MSTIVTGPCHRTRLKRGGTLIEFGDHVIQFGAPPETIKDTMLLECGVPEVFVLPRTMFNWEKGINVADMEFPLYFNFFIRGKRATVVGTDDQARRLAAALQEAVFGPKQLDLQQDRFDAGDDLYVPDIHGELEYFRGDNTLNNMVRYVPFRDGVATLDDGIEIVEDRRQSMFVVRWNGDEVSRVPGEVRYESIIDVGDVPDTPFEPPRFGVTCLGPSHGFDPNDNTSGFIIWLNHNGIMVDPPVNSTEWLLRSGVSPRLIDSIILTHCHADHDAGTFQKVLEEGRVTIYTTQTIMDSFLRKYSAFSGESPAFLSQLFSFNRVYVGRPFFLHGGEFDIRYSVHSIPTMAFRVRFQGKTFIYSSDHQGDQTVQDEMLAKGVISQQRRDQLANFNWDADVVYHEAGIAPLHTPLDFLASLPDEVKKKVILYHISKKDFDAKGDPHLRRATFGIENTLVFETEPFAFAAAYKLLDVIKRIEFLANLPLSKVQQFFSIVRTCTYEPDSTIVRTGEPGDRFFIILSGNARVIAGGLARGKRLGPFDYFGEHALLTGEARTADVVAETQVEALMINKPEFLSFIAGTAFETVLRRVITRRSPELWNTMIESRFLAALSEYQRMWLESLFRPASFEGQGVIVEQGNRLPGVFLIESGTIHVSQDGAELAELQRGDLMGMLHRIQRHQGAEYTFWHEDTVTGYLMDRDEVEEFTNNNPGAGLRINYHFREQLPAIEDTDHPGDPPKSRRAAVADVASGSGREP